MMDEITLSTSVTRPKTEEIPTNIIKFPEPFPTILKFPNFGLKKSQTAFYCIFINKCFCLSPPEKFFC